MIDLSKMHSIQRQDITVQYNAPLAAATTFRIGGCASALCTVHTLAALQAVLEECRALHVRTFLLGKGSNTLFADEGFDGIVLRLAGEFETIAIQGTCVTAGAAATLAKVCTDCAANNLAGLEFAFGIPGTVGGAVYMNAGAYGGEMKDVLQSITFLDAQGKTHAIAAQDAKLAYRTSIFSCEPWVILSAEFALAAGENAAITSRMKDFAQRRVDKQPLDMPSAGSTFKRPEGAFAGALIEQCGLRGYSVGGAQISEKHCGFVVNKGGATCADVLALTDTVCRIVEEKTGYVLEKEIRVVR